MARKSNAGISKRMKSRMKGNTGVHSISLATLLIMTINGFVCFSKIGIQGEGHFMMPFLFLVLLGCLFPIPLLHVVEMFVRETVEIQQYKNASRILYASVTLAFFYLIIVGILLFGFSAFVLDHVMFGKSGFATLLLLYFALAFFLVSGIYKSFLRGHGMGYLASFISLFQSVVLLIALFIATNLTMKYGAKVSAVLSNREFEYAYGALGVGISVFVCSIAGFCGIHFAMKRIKRRLNKKIRSDVSRRTMDIADLFRILCLKSFPGMLAMLLPLIGVFIYSVSWKEKMTGGVMGVLSTYNIGAFLGGLFTILILPVGFLFLTVWDKKETIHHVHEYDYKNELRYILRDQYKLTYIVTFFTVAFLEVLAPLIVHGFLGIHSALLVSVLRFGAPLVIIFGVAVVQFCVLQSLDKFRPLMITGGITLAFYLLFMFLFLSVAGMGWSGFLITSYISGILYIVCNYFYMKARIARVGKRKSVALLPFILAVFVAGTAILLRLLFALFLPDWLVVLLVFVITGIAYFIALIKSDCLNHYAISEMAFGDIFYQLGKMLRVLE
ncbi:MAG: polysaccharide biosynthesis C-terminal domain-containing protein [Lachnospiraceae bacterium]